MEDSSFVLSCASMRDVYMIESHLKARRIRIEDAFRTFKVFAESDRGRAEDRCAAVRAAYRCAVREPKRFASDAVHFSKVIVLRKSMARSSSEDIREEDELRATAVFELTRGLMSKLFFDVVASRAAAAAAVREILKQLVCDRRMSSRVRFCIAILGLCDSLHSRSFLRTCSSLITCAQRCLLLVHDIDVDVRIRRKATETLSWIILALPSNSSASSLFNFFLALVVQTSETIVRHDPKCTPSLLIGLVVLTGSCVRTLARLCADDGVIRRAVVALECGHLALHVVSVEVESPVVRRYALEMLSAAIDDPVSRVVAPPPLHGALLVQLLRKDPVDMRTDGPSDLATSVANLCNGARTPTTASLVGMENLLRDLRRRSRGALAIVLEDADPTVRVAAVDCATALIVATLDDDTSSSSAPTRLRPRDIVQDSWGRDVVSGVQLRLQPAARRAFRFVRVALQALHDVARFDGVDGVRVRALVNMERICRASSVPIVERLSRSQVAGMLSLLDDASHTVRRSAINLIAVAACESGAALGDLYLGCFERLRGIKRVRDQNALWLYLLNALVQLTERNLDHLYDENVIDALQTIDTSPDTAIASLVTLVTLARLDSWRKLRGWANGLIPMRHDASLRVRPDSLASGATLLVLLVACRERPYLRYALASNVRAIVSRAAAVLGIREEKDTNKKEDLFRYVPTSSCEESVGKAVFDAERILTTALCEGRMNPLCEGEMRVVRQSLDTVAAYEAMGDATSPPRLAAFAIVGRTIRALIEVFLVRIAIDAGDRASQIVTGVQRLRCLSAEIRLCLSGDAVPPNVVAMFRVFDAFAAAAITSILCEADRYRIGGARDAERTLSESISRADNALRAAHLKALETCPTTSTARSRWCRDLRLDDALRFVASKMARCSTKLPDGSLSWCHALWLRRPHVLRDNDENATASTGVPPSSSYLCGRFALDFIVANAHRPDISKELVLTFMETRPDSEETTQSYWRTRLNHIRCQIDRFDRNVRVRCTVTSPLLYTSDSCVFIEIGLCVEEDYVSVSKAIRTRTEFGHTLVT